ncbi:hypothetical protein FRC18_002005 [Serendipita sp. 400]|nr:hypothetical protein FRC18_002005 [Serendipita sp. 400]
MTVSLIGKVTKSGCMNKTVTVSVDRWIQHERTHKMIRQTTKVLTHDPKNVLRTEDTVRIKTCPRKSRKKFYELDVILKRGWDGLLFDRLNPTKAVPLLERVKQQQKQQQQKQQQQKQQQQKGQLDQAEKSSTTTMNGTTNGTEATESTKT